MREEIWLPFRNALNEEPKVFITPSFDNLALVSAKGQKLQCFECKGFEHVARNCKTYFFCYYGKRTGHIIFECIRRSPWKNDYVLQRSPYDQTALKRIMIMLKVKES